MNQARFADSELELTAYFTSSLGVCAQRYEAAGDGGLFDSNDAVARYLFGPMGGMVRAHRAVEWTLEQLAPAHRATLRLRFFPQRIGAGPYQTAMGPLAALGVETDAARAAFAKWQALSPKRLATAMVSWLDDEATRGSGAARREAIETQASGRLAVAMGLYDAARAQRVRLEVEAKRQGAERREATIVAALGGPAPRSAPRIKAREVRPALRQIVDMTRELFAAHADLVCESEAS